MTIEDTILQQYPQYAYMLQDPELRYLLIANLNPGKAFNSQAFTAELLNTNWWKTHSPTQRDYIQRAAIDPAGTEQTLNTKMAEVQNLNAQAGYGLTDPQIRWESTLAVQNGWNDQQLRQNLDLTAAAAHGGRQYAAGGGGQLGDLVNQIKAQAANYLLPMSDQVASQWANEIFDGVKTMQNVQGDLAHSASFTYGNSNPAMMQALAHGTTPKQFLDPQIQAVATTLEMSPNQIDPLSPKWSPLMSVADQKTGQQRMMTVPEATIWARSQPEYQHTKGATDAAYSMVNTLTQAMGQRK